MNGIMEETARIDYIRAIKGVIFSTSTFPQDAIDCVARIEGKKVVLINGDQLADLMITGLE